MRLNFLTPPPIPMNLPISLESEISKLKQCNSRVEVLNTAYDLLTKKYRGYRLKTIAKLFDLFNVDIDTMWSKEGFLHCTNMNYLMKILPLGSLKFDEKDIKFRWTLIHYYSPHEYLRVRVQDKKWLDVDLWGKVYGIKFGSHAYGFHSGRMKVTSKGV